MHSNRTLTKAATLRKKLSLLVFFSFFMFTFMASHAQVSPINHSPKLFKVTHQNIDFHLFVFDKRSHRLIIADQAQGPGSVWSNTAAAARHHKGVAAINAGFFTPEGKPLGILISNGEKRGHLNSSSLGSGLVYESSSGLKISRRAQWSILRSKPPKNLIQAGPMLLENKQQIKGLSTTNKRTRSFIAVDSQHLCCIAHASACSLAKLSQALSSLKVSDFKPSHALNLDGGRSSDFWVASLGDQPSLEIRPLWNKTVRNFIVIQKR